MMKTTINLNKFKCKNCKRGYKANNSFLSGGVCLRCIRKVLQDRNKGKGIYQTTSGTTNNAKSVKVKGSHVAKILKGSQVAPARSKTMEELMEEIKHNSRHN